MKIRAHHLLCLLGFRGEGYNPEFIKKMKEIKERLEKEPNSIIEVVNECDEICALCPYQVNNLCQKGKLSQKRTKEMDEKVLNYLDLQAMDTITSGKVFSLIKKRIGNFSIIVKICGQCGWREVCNYYLKLRNEWRKQKGLGENRKEISP